MIRYHILSLFPELFDSFINTSLIKQSIEKSLVDIDLINFRDHTQDKHKRVDDTPYGGGPGMVLNCDPIFRAVEDLHKREPATRSTPLLMLCPQGKPFDQAMAKALAGHKQLTMICGRYEGFDERIRVGLKPIEVSLGDFVMMGGEVAAMAIMEATARLVPGVLGEDASADEESFSQPLLEYPQYTRPPIYRGMAVPAVLRNGNHAHIDAWRRKQAHLKTKRYRPDLLESNQP